MEILDKILREMHTPDENSYIDIRARRYEIQMLSDIIHRIEKKGSFDIPKENYDMKKHITRTDVHVWSNICEKLLAYNDWKTD